MSNLPPNKSHVYHRDNPTGRIIYLHELDKYYDKGWTLNKDEINKELPTLPEIKIEKPKRRTFKKAK